MKTYVKNEDIDALLQKGIEGVPGIRYRELLRLTGLANGVLAYHIAALERSKTIRVERQSRITRYYPSNISDREARILKYVRHGTIRKIVVLLLEYECLTFNEIIERTGKAQSTVSSHLKRLREARIVSVRHGERDLYRLSEAELVGKVMSKYIGYRNIRCG
ncbi:ArsR family transcriptional regulator [Nitrososphaera sp.]|uniref:winged helix-turn-helix transcriptional regulator n=1 Tax=Nitrososphaera sp. TaxID=1971748 RepID=UPI00307DB179